MGDVRSGREGVGEGLPQRGTEQSRKSMRESDVSVIRTEDHPRMEDLSVQLVQGSMGGRDGLWRISHGSPHLCARTARLAQWIAPSRVLPRSCSQSEFERVCLVGMEERQEGGRRKRVVG